MFKETESNGGGIKPGAREHGRTGRGLSLVQLPRQSGVNRRCLDGWHN